MNKLLVVGGLGYLGSEVVKRFELKSDFEVTVLDINLFDRKFKPAVAKVVGENFVTTDLSYYKQFDKVVVCSDIDIPALYDSNAVADKYLSSYQCALVDLVKTGIQVVWVAPTESSQSIKDFNDATIRKMVELGDIAKVNIRKCPHLYGPSDSMRSDVFLNQVIRDFIMTDSFVLHSDPFEIIDFMNIDSYMDFLAPAIATNHHLKVTDYYGHSSLTRIMICNCINWIMGAQYELSVASTDISEINDARINFNERMALESFIKTITSMIQDGQCMEFVDIASDNNIAVSNFVVGYEFGNKLI